MVFCVVFENGSVGGIFVEMSRDVNQNFWFLLNWSLMMLRLGVVSELN